MITEVSWSKVQHLFEGMPITKLCLSRSRNEKGESDIPHPWLRLWVTGKAHIMMDWDLFKHRVPYEVAMREFIEIQRRNNFIFKDFVVDRIEVGIDNPYLVDAVNKRIKEEKETFGGFPRDTRLCVLYKNKLAQSCVLEKEVGIISQINNIAIDQLGFKVGILVLKEIHTYQKGEFSFNFVLQEKEIIKKIIGDHVNNRQWFQLAEVTQLPEKVFPGSYVTSERRESKNWKMIKEEEIKPKIA